MAALSISCNRDDSIDNEGVPPIEPPQEVKAFFNGHLPSYSTTGNKSVFNFSEIEYGDSECFVVNSDEDFKAIVNPETLLPPVDFEKYTLVVGQHSMSNPGFVLFSQSIIDLGDKINLCLTYKSLDGASSDQLAVYYFWGLYNKLPEKPLSLKINRI